MDWNNDLREMVIIRHMVSEQLASFNLLDAWMSGAFPFHGINL